MKEVFLYICNAASQNQKPNFMYGDFKAALYGKELQDLSSLVYLIDERLKYRDQTPESIFFSSHSPDVTFDEFVKTIASIDQNMRHDQIDLLFCKLDTDHSGKVSVKEFQKFFHDCYVMTEFKKHLVEFAQKNGQSIQHIFYNMSVADTMSKDEFTSLVQKITGNQFKLSEIDHLILKLDVDRNGFISKTELAEIYDLTQRQLYNLPDFISFRNAAIDYCKQLGLSLAQLYGEFAEGGKLGLEGLKKMAKKVMSEKADVLLIKGVLDKNFDTSIELSEFKEAIIGLDLKPEEILASIRRQVKSMRMTIDDLMNKFDRDQSQDLDYKEFSEFIKSLPLKFSFTQIEVLFDFINYDKNPRVTRQEILDCLMKSGEAGPNFFKVIEKFKEDVLRAHPVQQLPGSPTPVRADRRKPRQTQPQRVRQVRGESDQIHHIRARCNFRRCQLCSYSGTSTSTQTASSISRK